MKEKTVAKEHDEIYELFRKSKHFVFFTGAGISTNAGIPDFRSPNGLYRLIDKTYDLPFPEAVFEINFFRQNPEPFFRLSSKLLSRNPEPTQCHRFIAWLEHTGRVSLVMTQNIDMLHQKAGSEKVHECHGSYSTSTCQDCGKKSGYDEIEKPLKSGQIPLCTCGGVIKPDVVFFGEQLPDMFYSYLRKPPMADLIVIMGTSLNVFPSAQFALDLAARVPSVLVNLSPTNYDMAMTHVVNEDLDVFAEKLWDRLK